MYEKVDSIHQLSVYAGEAEKNHYALGQWRAKFVDWLDAEINSSIVQRTSQWVFGHILPQKQRAPYDVIDGILSKGLPIDISYDSLAGSDRASEVLRLVGDTYVPRYKELHRYPASGLMFVALSWMLGRTTRNYDNIANELEFCAWKEFDKIFIGHLKKRRTDEGMDYSNFVLANISLVCWRYVEANREMADGVYNDYFKQKAALEQVAEVAVEPDNGRTVGVMVDTPATGTIKIRGIGTPELSVEVIEEVPDSSSMEPDLVGAKIAHNLDFALSHRVGNWRKEAAKELMEYGRFLPITACITHIYKDLVGKQDLPGSAFVVHMRLAGFVNPEVIFSAEKFSGAKASYWLVRLSNHFKIDVPVPLHGLDAELYIAMSLLFEARNRGQTVGKDSAPFLELIEQCAPSSKVVYDEVYDYVMLHALCGCVELLNANSQLAGDIYRRFIGFVWNDFPMGHVEKEEKPAPQVEIRRSDVGLGNPPAAIQEDSLAQELERVALEALRDPNLEQNLLVHREGRHEAGVEPETHVTITGGLEEKLAKLQKAMALVPKPSSITISLNPDEDAEAQLVEMINRFGRPIGGQRHYGPEVVPTIKVIDTQAMHESIMKKVTRKKRGWLTGKFSMLHMGHINFIHQAATQCDELVVVLSHSDKRFKDPRLSYRNKMLWLRTTFKNEPHITVVGIDESNIPEYPNGWQAWSDLVKEKIGTDFDYIFTSEPGDQSGYNTYFPGQQVMVVDADRKGVDISATKIRGDMVRHWGMMPTVVRKDFVMRICIVGTESCVDGDTEYHNGERWVKISDWKPGDRVLQYQSDGTAKFVLPERYIKLPATEMWEMSNTYGTWSQVYTDDHDLVYVTSKGNLAKIPFGEVRKRHFESPYGFQGRFLASFDYRKGDVDIDENWLRLAIAVSADGTKAKHGWVLKIKKERKKTRLRELIQAAGLELHEGKLEEGGFTRFTVPLEYGVKEFPAEWIHLNSHLREVFIDEVFRWDGHKPENGVNTYFSTIEKNAEIVQFLLAASGVKTRVDQDVREDRATCYRVFAQAGQYLSLSVNKFTAHQRDKMIKPFTPTDGYKYCFTVGSGMLVLRRKGQIFITGNCGKTSLTKMLAKRNQTSWVEEYGRTYCEQDLCMDEDLLEFDDYGTIAARRYDMEQEAAAAANRVLFVDTAAMSTNYFCLLYEGRENMMVSAYQERERYDAYFYLTDDVPFVEDGLRKNRNRDNTRFLFEKMLFANAKRHGSEVFVISGNYNERFNKANEIVDELLARPLSLV